MIDGEAKEAILPSVLLWLVLRIKGPLCSIPRSNVELNGKWRIRAATASFLRGSRSACNLLSISALLVGENVE
jgi:hypothetical protein